MVGINSGWMVWASGMLVRILGVGRVVEDAVAVFDHTWFA